MDKQTGLLLVISLIIVSITVIISAGVVTYHDTRDRETLWQDDTIESLLDGGYDGTITVKELKTHGDIGLGTYDKLNGEMIVLDGVVYQALWDGSVVVADDTTTVPFAAVTYFDCDDTRTLGSVTSEHDLIDELNEVCTNRNMFYAVKVTGTFDLTVRSELPQEKPYKPLLDVLETDERRYTHDDVQGTIVAIYCPEFAENVNQVGWHFHFISDDRTIGGHVLFITGSTGLTAKVDATPTWTTYLPS